MKLLSQYYIFSQPSNETLHPFHCSSLLRGWRCRLVYKRKGEREEETQVNSTHDFLPPPVHNNNKENLRAFFLRQRQEQVENQSQDKVPQ